MSNVRLLQCVQTIPTTNTANFQRFLRSKQKAAKRQKLEDANKVDVLTSNVNTQYTQHNFRLNNQEAIEYCQAWMEVVNSVIFITCLDWNIEVCSKMHTYDRIFINVHVSNNDQEIDACKHFLLVAVLHHSSSLARDHRYPFQTATNNLARWS